VTVPEASVNEYDRLPAWEDEVRLASKLGHVQTVPQAERVEAAA
jgi:hypothetical protein